MNRKYETIRLNVVFVETVWVRKQMEKIISNLYLLKKEIKREREKENKKWMKVIYANVRCLVINIIVTTVWMFLARMTRHMIV